MTEFEELIEDRKKAMKLAEFAIIALIAWGISDSIKDSLLASGLSLPSAALAQWIAFPIFLLIYYKLIKTRMMGRNEAEADRRPD
jgi:hypothetical protein